MNGLPVDNLTLMSKMKIKREATLIGYRDKLVEAGLIEYRKGKKGIPNRYKLTFKNEVQRVVKRVVQSEVYPEVKRVVQSADIIRQDKNRQNNIIPPVSPLSAAVESYEENIGPVTRMIAEDMDYFIRQGMEEQVLTRAIRKAVDANVRKWSYVKGILRSLLNQGIKTVKEWEQNDSGLEILKAMCAGAPGIWKKR